MKKSISKFLNAKQTKIGSYNLIIAIIVLAIVVALNIFVSALPDTVTQFDISSAQLYSLTASSKAVVTNLDKDVTIYWIVQQGQENTVIEKLLGIYEALSDHITVVKKDPDQYPTFAEQYTDGSVYNNSLVVECGEKNRYISYTDIYESNSTSYVQSYATDFDGEGEITSAIDYVVSEDLPQIYMTTGHEEAELSSTFTNAIERENMETVEFSLLTVDEIPEEADCILINSPASDISEEEADMLISYVKNGGKLIVLSGPQEEGTLTNLNSVLEATGTTVNEGIVLDTDREHYAFQYPYNLLPTIGSSEITDDLIEDDSNVIAAVSSGLTVGQSSGFTVTSLLTTSDEAFSKVAGYSMSTTEKEEDDIDGPFAVAVLAESTSSDGALVWIATDRLTDDSVNSYSSGANSDFLMNALGYLAGDSESITIRSKSLEYNYLTISASQATLIKVVLIGILPAGYLLYGIDEVLRRRKGVQQ